MKVDLFDFELPSELVASSPLDERSSAKLLCVPSLEVRRVADLPSLLPANALVVMNDTKVIPARLYGTFAGREFEVLLHKQIGLGKWRAFVRGLRHLSVDSVLEFGSGLSARVFEITGEGDAAIEFSLNGAEFYAALEKVGHIPLPPYIKREDTAADKTNYQTVYAAHEGAVAAPTAGLHWTPELMDECRFNGAEFVFLTLHVGAGTFLPVKVEDTSEHKMHSEYGVISEEAASVIRAAQKASRPIVAIGTTSLRLLESSVDKNGFVQAFEGETDIFITPPHTFKTATHLMTNFHLPKSTLFMLVSAFCGMEEMRAAYKFAISSGFRFYSYGDASLLTRWDK